MPAAQRGYTQHRPAQSTAPYSTSTSSNMGVEELIDSHVSSSQCEKAVKALLGHATKIAKRKEEEELLPGKEENLWIVVSVKKVTPEKKLKAHKIPLAYPIIDPRTTSVCLITKDPQREYKDLLVAQNVKFVNRVVGIKKLKGKWKPFEARRMLMKESGMFLADERVIPLLPGLLGKIFFNAKKQPIPVNLTKKDVKTELEDAVSSTYMHQNAGSCTSVKFGTISQTSKNLVANLHKALPAIVKRIEGGWSNIQSLHIKTNQSTSLPIWTCDLAEGVEGRWSESKDATAVEAGWSGFEGEDDGASGIIEGNKHAETEIPKPSPGKGKKKRVVEESEELSAKVRKVASDTVSSTLKSKRGHEQDVPPTKSKKKNSSEAIVASKDVKPKKPKAKAVDETSSAPKAVAEEAEKHVHFNVDLTKAELKAKKANSGIEKKKTKVTEGRISGSIKENLVGKKSKSRL